jgi:KUP system potassium uptake protein
VTNESSAAGPDRRLLHLSAGALGVVYGDIGTSPLYAIRACFLGEHSVSPSGENVLGVLSLVVWALLVVVTVKYLAVVMRADNEGEGGVLALLALACPEAGAAHGTRRVLVVVGLFGAALLYGDGMLTPAISVLSAVEGLEVAAPALGPYVVPITVAILVALFATQRAGTEDVARVFGPISLVWFLALAILGVGGIAAAPEVLAALNPAHGVAFFAHNGPEGFFVLGAVFLVVTGAEALYADLGHFGAAPIRLAWAVVVMPALLLNYLGQGALLLRHGPEIQHPFFALVPPPLLYPVIALATVATIIASQAVISGCFSLTNQAIQLGYCPRLAVRHTSPAEFGQIYVPPVNAILMVAAVALVIGFGRSENLAGAYGVAVSTTMVVTTILFAVVARERWGWSRWLIGPLAGVLLLVDLAFLGANAVKLGEGGWIPVVVASSVFVLMETWDGGRRALARRFGLRTIAAGQLIADLRQHPPPRVPGTAVFMSARDADVPTALLHNLKHNKILHQQVLLLTVLAARVPRVPPERRLDLEDLGDGFHRLRLAYGFMERPNVPHDLADPRLAHLRIRLGSTTFFVGRKTLLPSEKPGMARWRRRLFAFMHANAQMAPEYFRLPPNRVVELGQVVEL